MQNKRKYLKRRGTSAADSNKKRHKSFGSKHSSERALQIWRRERDRFKLPCIFPSPFFFCLNLNFDLEYNLKICPNKRIWGINVGGFYFVRCHQFSEKNFLALPRSPGALGGLCFLTFFFSSKTKKQRFCESPFRHALFFILFIFKNIYIQKSKK